MKLRTQEPTPRQILSLAQADAAVESADRSAVEIPDRHVAADVHRRAGVGLKVRDPLVELVPSDRDEDVGVDLEGYVEPFEVSVVGDAEPATVLPASVQVEVIEAGLLFVRFQRQPSITQDVRLDAADGTAVHIVRVAVEVLRFAKADSPHESDFGVEVAPDFHISQRELVAGVVVLETARISVVAAFQTRSLCRRDVVEPVSEPAEADVGVSAVGPVVAAAAAELRRGLAVDADHTDGRAIRQVRG